LTGPGLHPVPDLPGPEGGGTKAEAVLFAASYRCPAGCKARPRVTTTVSVEHDLLCTVRARILEMKISAAA
jgi:hypothetical protein